MRVFHRTSHAQSIIASGFRDGTGKYMLDIKEPLSGVFVSDVPLDCNEGAWGDMLLSLEVPAELFEQHELVEDGKPYREAIIPAAMLNQHGPPKIENGEQMTRAEVFAYYYGELEKTERVIEDLQREIESSEPHQVTEGEPMP
jgi:hypothetical protein